ncbi:hypothetical protein COLO4_10437 [Corchorus olitorius]|uniref:Aminotransferase-like plant mobile domain-containing protein n=1 Tax=Corchorus olitorius TaxID=93759 RepID=A0A1R3K8M4_9ROSI|nr:hypothetical protein COLO4_10437 [Corchorus olitorius]
MTHEHSAALFDSFTELITPTFVLNDKLLVFEESRASTAASAEDQRFRAPLQFEHAARAQSAWATWTREVLKDAAFSDLLRNAGVLPSIILSRQAYYTKDNLAIEHLVRQWHKDTHIFIFAFGEVGITLEDVIKLTFIPLHGANDLDSISQIVVPALCDWKGSEFCLRRESFVLAWLIIIFGAFPEKRIMMQLAPIAVRIAAGGSFPLAPLYLGNLHHCLDLLVDNEVAGANSRVIYSCLDVYFLQIFLLEHYPRYAGIRALRESVLQEDAYGDDWNAFAGFATGIYLAVCGWKGKRYNEAKVSFLEVMDEEKEFCWRPYIKSDIRQHWLVFYPLMPNTSADKTFEMGVTREDTLVFGVVYAACCVPFLSLLDHTFQTTPYLMRRVRRQFRLNQRVPSVLPGSDSWGDCIVAFQHSRSFLALISRNTPYYVCSAAILPFPPPISKNKDKVDAESSQRVRNPKGKQVDESETNQEDIGAAKVGGSSPTLGPSQVDPSKTVSEKRKAASSSTSTTTKKAKTYEDTQSGVDVDINVAYEDIGTQAAEMNVGDTSTAHPIDLVVGDVLKDLSAGMHASASIEKTPVSRGILVSCVDGDTGPIGSTNKAPFFSLKASQHPPYHDEDSEEEDENEHYVPTPDFGGYVLAENVQYSKEYAQSLMAKMEDDEFTADVTADNFSWLYDEMIRIGPGAIQVHSRVYELAKRLIKAFPNLYNKGKLGSSVIGYALDLLCCVLYEMDETPLSNMTE